MILWEGKGFNDKKVACIATGLDIKSRNVKTGPMVQLALIDAKQDPTIKKSSPHPVCNKCPLIENGCYVNLGQSILNIYNKYKQGGYKKVKDLSIFSGKKLRWGSYGEGLLVGLKLFKATNKFSSGWTAYTHNWHIKKYAPFKKYMMASVESLKDAERAWAAGWRTFRIVKSVEDKTKDEIICPATPYYKNKTGKTIQCIDCMLCNGTTNNSPKSIVIVAHGGFAKLSSIRKYLEQENI